MSSWSSATRNTSLIFTCKPRANWPAECAADCVRQRRPEAHGSARRAAYSRLLLPSQVPTFTADRPWNQRVVTDFTWV